MVELQQVRQSEAAMQLYRLTPIHRNDPNWQTSLYREGAVIRAGSEDQARSMASKAFNTTLAPSDPGGTIARTLWHRPDAVRAEVIQDQRYSADGAAGILEPWGFT